MAEQLPVSDTQLSTTVALAEQSPAVVGAAASSAHDRRMGRLVRLAEVRDQLRDTLRGVSQRRMEIKQQLGQLRSVLDQRERETRLFHPARYPHQASQPMTDPSWQYARIERQRQAQQAELAALEARDQVLGLQYNSIQHDLGELNTLVQRLSTHLGMDTRGAVLTGV
jgi:hypothetical protein